MPPKQPTKQSETAIEKTVTASTAELSRVEPAGALELVPEYLRQTSIPLGAEAMRASDVAVARLALSQPLSAALQEQNTKAYIDGLKQGAFYNSMTKADYGRELFIIPLLSVIKRIRFKDFESGGGMLCRSENGKLGEGDPGGVCRLCEFSKRVGEDRPECDEVLAYHVLAFNEKGVRLAPEDWCVWGARSSAIPAAKFLNRLYKLRGPFDLFKGVYKLSSFWDITQKKPCWVPKVENAGWVTLDQLNFAKNFFLSVQNLEKAGKARTLDQDDAAEQVAEPEEV